MLGSGIVILFVSNSYNKNPMLLAIVLTVLSVLGLLAHLSLRSSSQRKY